MKSLLVISLVLAPLLSHAAFSRCEYANDRALIVLEQKGADVMMDMREQLRDYNSNNSPRVEADVSFGEGIHYEIHNKTLEQVTSGNRDTLRKLAFIAILSMGRFGGEEDMAGAYADEFALRAKCQ